MDKAQLYDTIEAYLEGELSTEDRRAFEREIAARPDLRAEVALHRKLHQELGDTGKARLRKQLQHISREFPLEGEGGKASWLWPLLGGLLVAVIAIVAWLAWPSEKQPSTPQEQAVSEGTLPEGKASTQDSLPPADSLPEAAGDSGQQPSRIRERPPAANLPANKFQAIPELESLAITKSRDAQYLVSAAAGATQNKDGGYQITLAGTLRSALLTDEDRILLSVYDNQRTSYLEGRPLASMPLELRPLEDEDIYAMAGMKFYAFEQKVEKALPAGLYYYLITREGQDNPLFVGKLIAGGPG